MFQGKGRLYNENPTALKQPFDYYNFDQIDEYWEFYEGRQFIIQAIFVMILKMEEVS